MSEFKYLRCVSDESGTEFADAIRSLVNDTILHLECERVLRETYLVPVFFYSKTIWRKKG